MFEPSATDLFPAAKGLFISSFDVFILINFFLGFFRIVPKDSRFKKQAPSRIPGKCLLYQTILLCFSNNEQTKSPTSPGLRAGAA